MVVVGRGVIWMEVVLVAGSVVVVDPVAVVGGVVGIDGGWRVRSAGRFHVDILRMLGGNLRVVTTFVDRPVEYSRAWCFRRPWVEVVLLAAVFDPDDPGDEPVGWVKQVGTERRACGWLRGSVGREHVVFVGECAECGDESLV